MTDLHAAVAANHLEAAHAGLEAVNEAQHDFSGGVYDMAGMMRP